MSDERLNLIRHYCDTTGVHLHDSDKDLLCMVLENPDKYNGFTSQMYSESDEGKDYRGEWSNYSQWQYRINIDDTFSIDKIEMLSCDDGYRRDDHWDWSNPWHITNIKRIVEILNEIRSEL